MAVGSVAVLGLLVTLGGCEAVGDFFKTDATRFLGPEKVIRQPEGSPINPILASIGPTDRSREIVPGAEFPREGDWEYTDEDYIIGPTDILDVSVLDLFAEGLETVLRRQVSASGYIDLPLLTERIKVEGLTKDDVRDAIRAAYSPDILRDPTVSVTIAARRNDTFSILGAVNRPGTYNILRRDMRLLEALALAGGITQTNIYYVYVIRPAPAKRVRAEAGKPKTTKPAPGAILPPLPPEVPRPTTQPTTQPAATQPAVDAAEAALRELTRALPGPTTQPTTQPVPMPAVVLRWREVGRKKPTPATVKRTDKPTPQLSDVGPMRTGPASRPATAPGATVPAPGREDADLTGAARPKRFIYSGGKYVAVDSQPATTKPAASRPTPPAARRRDPFGWRAADKSGLARVIAINLQQLRDGEGRMNIVIRNNDVVHVPTLQVGEFYVMGEVLRPGVYSLTGRRITVKMAVAAAGNMTALAWPENSILVRRIGDYQEQVIPLDLEAIFRGEEPDIYLKPDDVIAVGTDVRSVFMAVMRNAFRMTYGFGFIYDRNFADPQFVTPTSRRFTRW
jgi:protein involved in polysaccharide export with SLBB domain